MNRRPIQRLEVQSRRLSVLALLFILILLVVVFEGALRKWVSDDFTYPLVALRDGLAVYGISWALVKNKSRLSFRGFGLLFFMTLILLLWGLMQTLINQTSFLIYIIGLRFWLLYLWFAFFVGITLTDHDFKVIVKVLLLLLVCMTPLAVFQHFLPPTSFWNKQVDEDSFIFRVSADVVRTTGTFSFTMGYSVFLAMVSPFAWMSLDLGVQLWRSKWMSILAIVALLVATIVSGSRGAIVFFGILFLIYALSSVRYYRSSKKILSILMIIGVMLTLALSLTIFSRAVDSTRERFESAHRVEKPVDRLIYTLAPRGELLLLGEGIGMGSNIAAVFVTGKRVFQLAESENARIILEAGWFGFVVVAIKIAVVIRMGRQSLRIAKQTGSVMTLLIWAAVALALLVWPIVGQLTVNALGYLMFGLGLAALRLAPALSNRQLTQTFSRHECLNMVKP